MTAEVLHALLPAVLAAAGAWGAVRAEVRWLRRDVDRVERRVDRIEARVI